MTEGQTQALEQIREIEAASADSVSLVAEPNETKSGHLRLDLSIDTSGLDRTPDGLPLRARERFVVYVPASFPFAVPTVKTPHARFAGIPHVQWSRQLCLYQAPDVEWVPGDGMYGYVDRLWRWLERAALDQLDPVGGALHPPTTSGAGNSIQVVVGVDTPAFTGSAWTGLGRLRLIDDRRIDILGWAKVFPEERVGSAAAVILISEPMPWEFPSHLGDLLTLLAKLGISREHLLLVLLGAAQQIQEGEPLYVLLGTPMRGVRGGELRQHLTAWRLEPVFAEGVRLVANKYDADERRQKIGEEVESILLDWASKSEVSWCTVLEDRPEIVTRRDHTSCLSTFRGKAVAVWGCGALGGHVAIHLTRAGVGRIVLRDNSTVKPGVLVRQPFSSAEIGLSKAEALATQLRAIRLSDPTFEVEPHFSDVISSTLDRDDWNDRADVVIDCTASRGVRAKLERVRKNALHVRADTISMIIGREATHGLVVLAAADHTGGPADVFRRAKIDICRDYSLRHVADAFYPPPSDEDYFQPEPGCSSPTFVGSSADASALAALLLNAVASDLAVEAKREDIAGVRPTARAHAVVQPHALNSQRQRAFADFAYLPDVVTPDPRRGYQVRTSTRAWEQMQRWVARSRDSVGPEIETGGLSFGERDDAIGVIWVTEVDGPPPDSVARHDLFECGIFGTAQAHLSRESQSRGSIRYVGMWHTHPVSAPIPSETDRAGMKKILSDAALSPSMSLLSILGTPHTRPVLGTFVFDRQDIRGNRGEELMVVVAEDQIPASRRPSFGLALSGGGSRAIAFHLGCLRALHDRRILDEVGVLSAVSGGAILAAMYAYSDDDFESFEDRVRSLLRRGLQLDLARKTLSPSHLARAIGTSTVAGVAAKLAQVTQGSLSFFHDAFNRGSRARRPTYLASISPPFPRWFSRTTAFESVLRDRLFGDAMLQSTRRSGLDVVINATELRTGTAFRFGSRASACSRFGSVRENIAVATAVAASAAYPALLPALHKRYTFERAGKIASERVVLTDGGVYDNLGVSCLDPTRTPDFTSHVYPCDHLICCSAGHGQWDGSAVPYGWVSRMSRTVEATFRKAQDRTMGGLFYQVEAGHLRGLILPYLGMRDESLELDPAVGQLPDGFVRREAVVGYPTDFRSMSDNDFNLLSRRGEQLTRLLIDAHWPA